MEEKPKHAPAYWQHVEAIRYPDRFLIGTYHQAKASFSFATDLISWLGAEATAEEIGGTVRMHLRLSRANVDNPTDFPLLQAAYKKATGLLSIPAQMRNARYLGSTETNGQLVIRPTVNGGPTGKQRGYFDIPGAAIRTPSTISDGELGELLKTAWNHCE